MVRTFARARRHTHTHSLCFALLFSALSALLLSCFALDACPGVFDLLRAIFFLLAAPRGLRSARPTRSTLPCLPLCLVYSFLCSVSVFLSLPPAKPFIVLCLYFPFLVTSLLVTSALLQLALHPSGAGLSPKKPRPTRRLTIVHRSWRLAAACRGGGRVSMPQSQSSVLTGSLPPASKALPLSFLFLLARQEGEGQQSRRKRAEREGESKGRKREWPERAFPALLSHSHSILPLSFLFLFSSLPPCSVASMLVYAGALCCCTRWQG